MHLHILNTNADTCKTLDYEIFLVLISSVSSFQYLETSMMYSSQYQRLPVVIAALTLFVALSVFAQTPCTRHAHCISSSSSAPSDEASLCTSAGVCLPFPGVSRTRFYDPSAPALNITDLRASLDADPFPLAERALLCKTLGAFLADISPHIFVQRNVHNVDIQAEFNKLADNLSPSQSPFDFHLSVVRTFLLLNDYHTLYQPPKEISFSVAALGVTINRFYSNFGAQPRFLITDVLPGLRGTSPGLTPNATVLSIDGVPVLKYAMTLGEASVGANDAARLRRGTRALTERSLAIDPIPTSPYADLVLYKKGKKYQVRLPWRYTTLTYRPLIAAMIRQVFPHLLPSLDTIPTLTEHFPKVTVVAHHKRKTGITVLKVPKPFDSLYSAYLRKTAVGTVAVLKFPTFNEDMSPRLAAALRATFAKFPSYVIGLLIDIRNNAGGFPSLTKYLTELYSDVEIPKQPLQIRASKLAAAGLQSGVDTSTGDQVSLSFLVFVPALISAFQAGEPFAAPAANIFGLRAGSNNGSAAFALYPRPKRMFFKPVITLSDAVTYSSGDVFAALQVDSGASLLVGTDPVTGGGGASVNSYREFQTAFPNVLKPLPKNVGFNTAVGRFFRTGLREGQFIEAFGVGVDVLYNETRNDIMKNDKDLFEFIGKKLKELSK